jgi:hypothetical protein
VVLSAAFVGGCDMGPSESEVAQSKKERADAITKQEAEDAAGVKKTDGKMQSEAGNAKSIKGRLGGGKGAPD